MSRYEDYYDGPRSHHGDRHGNPLPYPPSEGRRSRGVSPRAASPGHTTWPTEEVYRPQTSTALQVPQSPSRPRSLPPPTEYHRSHSSRSRAPSHRRSRRDSRSDSRSSDARDGDRSPMDKARGFFTDNFSHSTTGLGVGVLGAVVGGLAAREANEATTRYRGRHYNHHEDEEERKRNQMISTVFGAAIGALGANAFEKRLEGRHERDRSEHHEDYHSRHYRDGDRVLERRHVVASRPRSSDRRSSSRSRREFDPWDPRTRGSRGGFQREVDPDARSWRDVEDWVYDDRKSGGASGSLSRHGSGDFH